MPHVKHASHEDKTSRVRNVQNRAVFARNRTHARYAEIYNLIDFGNLCLGYGRHVVVLNFLDLCIGCCNVPSQFRHHRLLGFRILLFNGRYASLETIERRILGRFLRLSIAADNSNQNSGQCRALRQLEHDFSRKYEVQKKGDSLLFRAIPLLVQSRTIS